MKKTTKFLIFIAILLMLVFPAVSFAYTLGDPLVPCDNSTAHPCDFNAILTLINNLITFMLKYMAIPIAAIMFAYAGFLLVTAGGEAAHARTKAKEIFTNAIIGLIIAVAATLIVKMILSIAGYTGPSFLF